MADARRDMVVTAAKLFQQHGYHAVGFRRIIEESGAPRGSIYHHFPGGKEQLGVEAIQLSGTALVSTVEALTTEAEDIAGTLTVLGELLAGWLERSAFQTGCPVATVALECAPDTTGVADACREVFRNWIGVLQHQLVAEGWAADPARSFATTIVAALEGALLLSRVERDASSLRMVCADLAARAADPAAAAVAGRPGRLPS